MNKTGFTILGFGLFLIGTIALILSLVGLQLTFLDWIDGNRAVGLLVKLLMIMFGVIIVYVAKTSDEN